MIDDLISSLHQTIALLEKLKAELGETDNLPMDSQIAVPNEDFNRAWQLEKSKQETERLLELERLSLDH